MATRSNPEHDSSVLWLTGLFVFVAFVIFIFAIIRHKRSPHDVLFQETTPDKISPSSSVAGKFTVLRVADGDSLTLIGADDLEISVRLRGIDAPELGQPYGYEAKQALLEIVDSETLGLSQPKKGKYGRYIADVYLGDIWVNQKMVVEGHAWCDQVSSFNRILYEAEQRAKTKEKGLWALPIPTPPWIWRAERK